MTWKHPPRRPTPFLEEYGRAIVIVAAVIFAALIAGSVASKAIANAAWIAAQY